MATSEPDYDPIKNPRPEDLHSYGVVSALIWFFALLAVVSIIYWLFTG